MNAAGIALGVQATINRYAHAGDRGDAEELAGLFLEDGVLEAAHGVLARGRAAIRDYLGRLADAEALERPAFVRHHVSDIDVVRGEPGRAEVRSYFLVVTDRGIDHSGRYRDILVLDVDGVWRFERRSVRLDAPPLSRIFTIAYP